METITKKIENDRFEIHSVIEMTTTEGIKVNVLANRDTISKIDLENQLADIEIQQVQLNERKAKVINLLSLIEIEKAKEISTIEK